MFIHDGELTLSATDLTSYLTCLELTNLQLAAASGARDMPDRPDPELDVVTRRGLEHERAYLARLRDDGRDVVAVASDGDLLDRVRETADAMRTGREVIYQGALAHDSWVGFPDFIVRVRQPSSLGPWAYEIQDAKLARRVKASALLQMCLYSELLGELQGCEPELLHVVLGDLRIESFTYRSIAAYYRTVARRLRAHVQSPVPSYPEPVDHCATCRWIEACDQRRREDDYLSLVAGLGRYQARKLQAAGIGTVAELGAAPASLSVPRMGSTTVERLRNQARLQVAARADESVLYELLDFDGPSRGLALLPAPSEKDVFFDIEGDPFVEDGGLEYLLGALSTEQGTHSYKAFWAHDPEEERSSFEAFVDFVITRLDADPTMHVYHYAPYEQTALKRLMGRHGTREREVDRLLRGGVLVDLYPVVRQSVRISQESYSLKELEPLYMDARSDEITDAGSSIVAYERWLETRDVAILADLEQYNEVDCVSTLRLRSWLEDRRDELARVSGSEIPRPDAPGAQVSDAQIAADEETSALVDGLLSMIPDDPAERSDDDRAVWLLAQLLNWHRREERPQWWDYYRRLTLSDEELVDDPESIGVLRLVGEVGQIKRSALYEYRFDPAQVNRPGFGGGLFIWNFRPSQCCS